MRNAYLLCALTCCAAMAAPQAWALNIFRPGDPVVAIDTTMTGTTGSSTPPSGAEEASNILDSTSTTKYLNFGETQTGFIVTAANSAILKSFTITTANDAVARDPATYEIYGTNAAIVSVAHSRGDSEPWTLIGTGSLALPDARETIGPAVNLTNNTAFTSYKMIFPTVKDEAAANSMQIADVNFYTGNDASGTNILAVGNPIIAIRNSSTSPPTSNSPLAEGPANAVDRNTATKYLNFGEENSGIIVTPSIGASIATGIKITTANDAEERDPLSFQVYGTNETVTTPNHQFGNEQNWTLIASGNIDAPLTRFTESDVVTFANNQAYTAYKIIFPTVRDAATANSMQIAEVQLTAQDPATLVVNRQTGQVRIRADQNVTFSAYEVESLVLGLNPEGWDSITSTNGDPNDTWMETSSTSELLAEMDVPTSGSNNGISLTAGNSLALGNIWQALPVNYESSLTFSLFGLTGNLIADSIEFEGTEIPLGDYSGNGTVGPEDWPAFKAGLGGNYQGMSLSQAYLGGDLDGDFDSDIYDFNLFVEAAGGFAALFGTTQVPEPSSVVLVAAAIAGGIGYRLRTRRFFRLGAILGVALTSLLASLPASAQTFEVVGGKPIGITSPDTPENANSGPEQLFDDIFFEQSPTNINQSLFAENYTELMGTYAQFAGQGGAPKTVFLDYGSPVTANWFAYAQRAGGDPLADRVGKFELWFSNTDFGGTLPATAPDSVVELLPDDQRLFDSTIRPYTLGGDKSGRYVALRLTLTDVSATRPTNNLGGHEFRLLDGPATLILDVNRQTGAMTIRNNGAGAQDIELQSYSIESPSGALNSAAFNGIGGDAAAFPKGTGTGNGWEIGGGSNVEQLIEANFSGTSTIAAGTTNLQLGNGYFPLSLAEDLVFRWTTTFEKDGELKIAMYDGVVNYIGTAPDILLGDYNGDDVVDAADYVVWRNNFGTTNVMTNDSTPGSVGIDDYERWKANYGSVGSGALAVNVNAVPEPHSIVLSLLFTVVGATAIRRRLG